MTYRASATGTFRLSSVTCVDCGLVLSLALCASPGLFVVCLLAPTVAEIAGGGPLSIFARSVGTFFDFSGSSSPLTGWR